MFRPLTLVAHAAVVALCTVWSAGASAAPITKQVTIRPIMLCDTGGANCATVNTYEASADKAWSQAGVDFAFLPTVNWLTTTFNNLDVDVGEDLAMFAAGSGVFGDPATTGIINMYFVNTVTFSFGTLYGEGCGGAQFAVDCNNTAGVMINATAVNAFNGGNGRIDTVGHEVGHVLNLGHTDFGAGGANNLMTSGGSRSVPATIADITPDGAGLSVLTNAQITEALGSSYVQDVPEPASLALLGFALSATFLARRRQPVRTVAG